MLPEQFDCLERLVAQEFGVLVAEFDGYDRQTLPDFRRPSEWGPEVDGEVRLEKVGMELADGRLQARFYGEAEEPPYLGASGWPSLGDFGGAGQDLDCLAHAIAARMVDFMRETIASVAQNEEPVVLLFLRGHEIPRVFSAVPGHLREECPEEEERVRVRYQFGAVPAGVRSASG